MSLAYRHMNYTLQAMAHEEARKSAEWYASLPEEERADRSHYWFVEKKSKNGKKWLFVRDAQWTKSEAAAAFRKFYQNREVKFRIRHLLAY
jgi:hypothetical protein